ncbi:hypothetical protein AB0C34_17630 [Nocardia sp. NPDC049220]|uniref:hypothetical protein n=1 Tax=Nocardia sp. NPDC049220 TaxID=3155273 RepID=UPI0033F3DA5C
MGNLWVATHDGNWLRADQIAEVAFRGSRETDSGTTDYGRSGPETFDVIVRLTGMTIGHWYSNDGDLHPLTRTLANGYTDPAAAQKVALRLTRALITHADARAQITVSNEKINLSSVNLTQPEPAKSSPEN